MYAYISNDLNDAMQQHISQKTLNFLNNTYSVFFCGGPAHFFLYIPFHDNN